MPIPPSMFNTWPAKSEMGHRKKAKSPTPPVGGAFQVYNIVVMFLLLFFCVFLL